MTKAEMREKYKDAPSREDMTIEQERELVSDLFDVYEQEGFAPAFWSISGDFSQRIGQHFTVVGRAPEYPQTKTPYSADLELLPMWTIRFKDGSLLSAYPDEIIPSIMRDSGCPEEYLTEKRK